MDRRQFNGACGSSVAALILLTHARAHALSLGDLTNAEASSGLKTALEKGALAAVGLLGKTDGFLGNEKVRIPLPGFLNDAAKLLKTLGQSKRVDELGAQKRNFNTHASGYINSGIVWQWECNIALTTERG